MAIELTTGLRRRGASGGARRGRRQANAWPAALAILVLAGLTAFGLAPESALRDAVEDALGGAGAGGEIVAGGVTVTDGDTIRLGAERIRIENLDTPELGDGAECLAERRLADLALQRAGALFAQASEVSIARNGEDQYGRTLARVTLDGEDFGRVMVREGYAAEWTGRRADWCA